MESTGASDVHLLLNSPFVQNVLKPLVIVVGSYFSIEGFIYLFLLLQYVWSVYILPYFNKVYTLRQKYGDFVVITNASDPLGAAFAKAFLLKGHSIILVMNEDAKANEKMKVDFEKERALGGGQVIIITKNIQKSDREIYQDIKTQLKSTDFGIKSGILLNNAGFVGQLQGNFLQHTDSHVLNLVHNNVVDCLMITKAVLEVMVQVKTGLILNVSIPDTANFFTDSGFPKTMRKFTDEFNKIVRREFSELKNLEVEAMHPGSICYGDGKESTFNPSTATFVDSAIYKIGKSKVFTGYFYHSLVNFFKSFIPSFVYPIAYSVHKMIYKEKDPEYPDYVPPPEPDKQGYQEIPSSKDP